MGRAHRNSILAGGWGRVKLAVEGFPTALFFRPPPSLRLAFAVLTDQKSLHGLLEGW